MGFNARSCERFFIPQVNTLNVKGGDKRGNEETNKSFEGCEEDFDAQK